MCFLSNLLLIFYPRFLLILLNLPVSLSSIDFIFMFAVKLPDQTSFIFEKTLQCLISSLITLHETIVPSQFQTFQWGLISQCHFSRRSNKFRMLSDDVRTGNRCLACALILVQHCTWMEYLIIEQKKNINICIYIHLCINIMHCYRDIIYISSLLQDLVLQHIATCSNKTIMPYPNIQNPNK